MKRRMAIFCIAAAILVVGSSVDGTLGRADAYAQGFIEGSEDLPLAPTLTAVEDAGMVFDSPSGKIVEAFATGATDRQAVLKFYADTLPALGWNRQDIALFQREGERLAIDFFGSDGALSVRFTLSPE